jgi:hypothetical protein
MSLGAARMGRLQEGRQRAITVPLAHKGSSMH